MSDWRTCSAAARPSASFCASAMVGSPTSGARAWSSALKMPSPSGSVPAVWNPEPTEDTQPARWTDSSRRPRIQLPAQSGSKSPGRYDPAPLTKLSQAPSTSVASVASSSSAAVRYPG